MVHNKIGPSVRSLVRLSVRSKEIMFFWKGMPFELYIYLGAFVTYCDPILVLTSFNFLWLPLYFLNGVLQHDVWYYFFRDPVYVWVRIQGMGETSVFVTKVGDFYNGDLWGNFSFLVNSNWNLVSDYIKTLTHILKVSFRNKNWVTVRDKCPQINVQFKWHTFSKKFFFPNGRTNRRTNDWMDGWPDFLCFGA